MTVNISPAYWAFWKRTVLETMAWQQRIGANRASTATDC